MISGRGKLSLEDLVYRDYCDGDDEPCKALEMRAMQGFRFPKLQRVASFFFKAGFTHRVTFDAKSRQYEDYIIRVAEDPSNPCRIVGVCCAVLKKAVMHSKMCKLGYVFDLRVDESYQGCGIGKILSNQVEAACVQKGAEYLYLSVNFSNVKAKTMYAKAGFVHASFRSPALSMLVSSVSEDSEVMVRLVPAAEALELTSGAFKDADMALCDMKPLFESRLYEGTYMASCGQSYAGVSCWNGNAITGFRVERVLLPMTWWSSLPARIAGGSLICILCFLWARMLQASFVRACATEAYRWFLANVGISCAASILLWKLWPLISYIAHNMFTKDAKLKHRLFGPFGKGPIEEQIRLMRAVLKKVHNIARADGYAVSLCNLDRDDPLRSAFASSKFYTLFLQKRLTSGPADPPALSATNFFDPRDL